MSCSDNFIVPAANPCLGVKEVIAGTNVTITGSIYTPTINATGGGGGGGVTSLAYTTGINGSATFGAVTLSNTGVTSIGAGTGISISATGTGGTGDVTINNSGITSLVSGSNIAITGGNTINIQSAPLFDNSMGFNSFGTNSVFQNVVYPYGSPEWYPYMYNGTGTVVNNTIGAKQFWATDGPGNTSYPVMRYGYYGIVAQQTGTGTSIPFLNFNNTTGDFTLSNTNNVVNSIIAGAGVSIASTGAGGTGDVTIYNTTTGGLYGTAILNTDTFIYNTTDYVYWTSVVDNVNTYLYTDPKIVYPTQSGIYHLTWNLNIMAAFIGGGSNFIITTRPGVFDRAGTTFTRKNGGTVNAAIYTGTSITDLICVSGSTQISFNRATDRGFAIQYTVSIVSPGAPSPPIPLIAFTNNSGSLNYTICTLTLHKLGDLSVTTPAPSLDPPPS